MKQNKTTRETYSRLIGYEFGTTDDGRSRIFNGGYWDPDTNKKQYEFLLYEPKTGEYRGNMILDYKGFREIIDQFDWPKR